MPLTSKQIKIAELLNELDNKIAEAYVGGIITLQQGDQDKIAQSAHSLREVIYMFTRLDEIKKLGRVKTISTGKTRKQDLIKHLDPVRGAPEEAYVLYDELVNDKLKWFAIVAHHSEYPSETKFRKRIEEFENLLEKILKPHFEVIDEITKIIKIPSPTKNDFNNLKQLISRNTSAYNYFFQNASAVWLPFLFKDKYLKNPPHIIVINGEKKFSGWTPAEYLRRSSLEKPKEVSQIILSFNIPKKPEERNPWLLDYFVKAALLMPPKYGKLIAQKIYKERWIESAYHHYLDGPISELMKKLADAGFENEAILLSRTILNVTLGELYVTGGIIEEYKKVRDVKPIIDNFWYGERLEKDIPHIFTKFPKSTTNLLIELVTKLIYLENVGRGDKKSKVDSSAGWRPAIEEDEQNSERDFRSQLLGKLGLFLFLLGEQSIPLLKQSLRKISEIEYPAFRRLELYVYWNFPKHFKNELNKAITSYFDNYELHHEYFHLLKNAFQFASTKTRRKYLEYIEKGPGRKRLEYWRLQSEHQKPGFVTLRTNFWKADKLAPIVPHLTKKEKGKFRNLIKIQSNFEHPDFHIFSSGARMSESKSELKDNLNIDEVFNFVKNHKSKDYGFGYHDGTSQKFRDYVKNNSTIYSKSALKCLELGPIFIERFIDGMRDAIKQKNTIDWEPVISLCEKIIEHSRTGKYDEKSSIFQAIAWLLEDGLDLDSINFLLRDRVWKLLNTMTNIYDLNSSDEEQYPRDNYFDALGISINNTDGIVFHSIMKYAIWCEKHLNKKRIFVNEVKNLLSNYLDQKLPVTVSRQAVLGHYLPTLYYYDKDWIKTKLSNLFSNKSESLSRAAWDAYLTRQVYSDTFNDLIEQYEIHIAKLQSPSTKDDRLLEYDQRVIDHVTTAYIFGIKNSNSIFQYMITHSHEKVLERCAWHMGRILKGQKEKPNKLFDIEAFRKLWKNSSLTSNADLQTWVKYSPFDGTQTLQLLYNSLTKSDKSIRFLSFIMEELGSYAKTHPQSTLRCLDMLIRKRSKDPEFHIARNDLKNVLQILLENNKTKKKTIQLIHYLGELNFNEFKDLLSNK